MRTCDGCTMCCKLLGVEELTKAPGIWCRFIATNRKGCAIYHHRPGSCKTFECFYIMSDSDDFPDELRPDRSNIVLATGPDGKTMFGWQNQGHPEAYAQEPMYTMLKALAHGGVTVIISKAPGSSDKIVMQVNRDGVVEKKTVKGTPMDKFGKQDVELW